MARESFTMFDRPTICKAVSEMSVVLYGIAILQLALTFVIPLGRSTPAEVYSRNIITAFSNVALGYYMKNLARILSVLNHSGQTMKEFRLVTFLVTLACVAKVAVSVYYCVKFVPYKSAVLYYYAADGIVWIILTAFLWMLFKRLPRR